FGSPFHPVCCVTRLKLAGNFIAPRSERHLAAKAGRVESLSALGVVEHTMAKACGDGTDAADVDVLELKGKFQCGSWVPVEGDSCDLLLTSANASWRHG